jgi:hypothetical protein
MPTCRPWIRSPLLAHRLARHDRARRRLGSSPAAHAGRNRDAARPDAGHSVAKQAATAANAATGAPGPGSRGGATQPAATPPVATPKRAFSFGPRPPTGVRRRCRATSGAASRGHAFLERIAPTPSRSAARSTISTGAAARSAGHVVPISRVGHYELITRGVTGAQSPTTLVIQGVQFRLVQVKFDDQVQESITQATAARAEVATRRL